MHILRMQLICKLLLWLWVIGCGLHHTTVVRYGRKWPQSPRQCSMTLESLLISNVVIEQFARHTLSELAYSLPI